MNDNSSLDDERYRILQMVEEGQISASEAAKMLSALGTQKLLPSIEAQSPAPEPWGEKIYSEQIASPNQSARWFRVRVTDLASGRRKVTVNLPIGLVNWGIKIGARYAPEVSEFDFNELAQILQSGAEGKLIDVVDDEDGEHVEIFID